MEFTFMDTKIIPVCVLLRELRMIWNKLDYLYEMINYYKLMSVNAVAC
jgi:hypothetical protein